MRWRSAKIRHPGAPKPIEIRQILQHGESRFASRFGGQTILLVLTFAVPGFLLAATFAGSGSRENPDGQSASNPVQRTNVTAAAGITFVHFRGNGGIPIKRERLCPWR